MANENAKPPRPPVEPARKRGFGRISFVWIVPLIALLVVLAVAWRSYAERGPVIEVSFEEAAGIKAGATELRYRDVAVGLVESVGFTESLDRVLVRIRVDKDVAPFIDSGARFWVVRPQITTQGVSGLDTVLSGVFIEGLWDQEKDAPQGRFDGLADAPLDRPGAGGLHLTLRAAGKASLTENTPILYRGVKVGRIGKPEISRDGATAQAVALIESPHDRLITTATRFWDASGFSFSFGPKGAAIDFSSVASLVSGGITFDTMVSGGVPVEQDAIFTVYPEESAARVSVFAADDSEVLTLSVVFTENIAGLSSEAPVELNGLRVGEVTAVNARIDPEAFGDDRVRLVATLNILPGRLGLDDAAGAQDALDYLGSRVEEGLRARLATASILTGGLKIELVDAPDAPPATITEGEDGAHYMPTTKSDIADVSATAQGVFERINALPIEEVMISATELFEEARALIASDDVRAVPGTLNGLLGDARKVVGSDEVQALPAQLAALVDDLNATVDALNEAALIERLTAAVDDAAEAAKGVNSAVEGVPELVGRLNAVAAKAQSVKINEMADELTALIRTADALLGSDDAKALPGELNGALAELRSVLKQLREGGVVENATAALDSASNAADAVAEAGRDLPELIVRARGVLNEASATLKGYQAENGLGRDARAALIEVQKAAKAVASLARAIERNPNSLLTGR
ncbi:MCE family protein [Roseovarius spongiae]|uniref:MCE family protein n=1 Tax=Roseovarius spongiae TaxID=2320272 RepID=A0A3A8BA00_9RHOB|nr:MlaD family protein [Roseovarius spongiae]RKF15285.1 MCE family protein [Roseovarius spongiae]